MTIISENEIELLAIEKLESQGFKYIYGATIAPDGDFPERANYEQVLLLTRLKRAIDKINPDIPEDARIEALKEIQRIVSPELLVKVFTAF